MNNVIRSLFNACGAADVPRMICSGTDESSLTKRFKGERKRGSPSVVIRWSMVA
jgi:hypothetical protein